MIRDTSAQDRPLAKPTVGWPWRRWVSGGALAIAVIAGIGYVVRGWLGAERSADRSRIRIATVERGTLVRDIVADGRVVAANSPTLYAIAAGTVDFHVRAGDKVTRGQPLATVASPELQSRLTQEQATMAGLEAGVGRAGLDIEHGRANAQRLIAQADVDRQGAAREVEINNQMFAKGVIPELELRRSEDALKKAEIAVQHARIEAGLAGKELVFDLGTRKQGLDRQRAVVRELERQVAALEITSPVDGQVGQLLVAQRATVAANAPIVTVVDLGAFELEIRVADSFARDLGLGMAAEIRAGTATFPGRVRSVSPEVVEGNVATRLEFVDKRPDGLRQNQRLTARILIEERPNVVKVERGPFLETGGGNTAYFVTGGIAERRSIRTGAISLDAVEIVSGASPGDRIVVTGADSFGTAQRVRIAD
ncbi:MAG TPA: HlyD family efflux transporter periplasmic adaptor subunit [Kofleriaceae bacterium]|jgi:HlyD family secretion protein|nr:HlyD family efflux transporter periplasmic adaptor subunit [Kofleriaceae bacterium]